MYGNELPASHSAHPLSFTAHSATTWGHCNISPHCLNQQNHHCEEQHKVEATLPEPPLGVCLWWICISSFYSGTCACRINVVLVFLRNIFTSSTTFWLIKASKKWQSLSFNCSFIKRCKRKEGKSYIKCNVRFSVAQQGNSTVKTNMYSNVWKRGKKEYMMSVNICQYHN